MKKLLLGALLIVGATAYAGKGINLDASGNASGALTIHSLGSVVDGGSSGMLIIEATSAGLTADGSELSFDFGAVPINTTKELTGTFIAKVLKDGAVQNLFETTNQGSAVKDDYIMTVKLYEGATENTNKGKYSQNGVEVISTSGDGKSVSKLFYQLRNDSQVINNIYEGTILAKLEAGSNPGSFDSRDGKIEVSVTKKN